MTSISVAPILEKLDAGQLLIDMKRGFRIQKVRDTYKVSAIGNADFETMIKTRPQVRSYLRSKLTAHKVLAASNPQIKPLIRFCASILFAYWSDEDTEDDLPHTAYSGKEMVDLGNELLGVFKQFKLPIKPLKDAIKATADGRLDGEEKEMVVYELAEAIRTNFKQLERDRSIGRDQLLFLKGFYQFIRTGNEKTLDTLSRHVNLGGDSKLAKRFVGNLEAIEKDNQKHIVQLKALVKKLSGDEGTLIDAAKRDAIKKKNPEGYKKYLALRRELVDNYKKTLQGLIRTSNQPLMDIKKASRLLEQKKISHPIPKDFEGKIDENGKYYTKFDEPLDGTPSGEVKMNPQYTKGSTNYVLQTKAPFAQGFQYVFTTNARQNAKDQKFAKVDKFLDKFDQIAKKWRSALADGNQHQLEAAIIETIYLTQGRIGGQGMTAGEKTFGISTLLCKQVKAQPNRVRMAYVGKKGMKQVHEIHPDTPAAKQVIKIINRLVKGKSPTDKLWKEGTNAVVDATDVNTYLKGLGSPVTIHKFRTLRGTMLMKELLAKKDLGKKPADKTVLDWFKKCAEQVGKELGHMNKSPVDGSTTVTGNTAITHYINPSVMLEYFDKYGTRPPALVEKLKADL